MSIKTKVFDLVNGVIGLPEPRDYLKPLIQAGEVQLAMDFGCGFSSHLSEFRPRVKTIGIDKHQEALDAGRSSKAHDHYVLGDILALSVDDLRDKLEEVTGRRSVDLVTAFGSIEHLQKRDGWTLLDRLEQLTDKYVLIDTPNGFVPQGPEFGNPFQRHLSGWYPKDFLGLGYRVYGSHGTRYLRGYMGEKKYPIPGLIGIDLVLSRLLMANRFPQHGFNITAIKDVRGVPARYPDFSEWRQVA